MFAFAVVGLAYRVLKRCGFGLFKLSDDLPKLIPDLRPILLAKPPVLIDEVAVKSSDFCNELLAFWW